MGGSWPFCDFTLSAPIPLPESYPTAPRTIGEHIRKTRMDRGLTLGSVALEIGVGIPTVANWECGRYEPREKYWSKISRFLGYDPGVER